MIYQNEFRDRAISKVKKDLSHKLLKGEFGRDDPQFNILRHWAPCHSLVTACEAHIDIESGNYKKALSKIFTIDVETDDDASFFAAKILHFLYTLDVADAEDVDQFFGDLIERNVDTFDSYYSSIKNNLYHKISSSHLMIDDPDISFMQLIDPHSPILAISKILFYGEKVGVNALMKETDILQDEETASLVLEFVNKYVREGLLSSSNASRVCKKIECKFYSDSCMMKGVEEVYSIAKIKSDRKNDCTSRNLRLKVIAGVQET